MTHRQKRIALVALAWLPAVLMIVLPSSGALGWHRWMDSAEDVAAAAAAATTVAVVILDEIVVARISYILGYRAGSISRPPHRD